MLYQRMDMAVPKLIAGVFLISTCAAAMAGEGPRLFSDAEDKSWKAQQ